MADHRKTARQFMADARRLEARAIIATSGFAAELRKRAANCRAAAARLEARARRQEQDELPFGQ